MNNTVYLVVPCYNEEAVLPSSSEILKEKMQKLMEKGKISRFSKICFVDDGSKDRTWEIIEKLCKNDRIFASVKLSRNRGHQNALLAGLMTVKNDCDAAVSIDADLQDDIDAIDEMVDKFNSGSDIVYGIRNDRHNDTFFKKVTAQGFYKFMDFMGAETIYNHADFRLMSKRALEALGEFKEANLFLRGMVKMVGFNEDAVYYERKERKAGESKYTMGKMLHLAFDGITSFSVKPLSFICLAGLVFMLISLVTIIATRKFLLFSLWFIGGANILAIGIVGEYTGKIYSEVKGRPRYIIEKYIDNKD